MLKYLKCVIADLAREGFTCEKWLIGKHYKLYLCRDSVHFLVVVSRSPHCGGTYKIIRDAYKTWEKKRGRP